MRNDVAAVDRLSDDKMFLAHAEEAAVLAIQKLIRLSDATIPV